MIKIENKLDFNSNLIPKEPGVYIFKDSILNIIYVGKAKDLRNRVKSYFNNSPKAIKTEHLVSKIKSIEFIVVGNEVEALLLENKLIKQHTPKYNINLKDAKTFAYIAISKEKFPRIFSTRKVSNKLESFGPYTDGGMRRDLQTVITKIFKLRTCKTLPKRACLNYHLGICTAPCILNVNYEQYQSQVDSAREFLNGNIKPTIELLNSSMKQASNELKYEKALEIKNQLLSIELLKQKQIVDNEKRYDQDIVAFANVNDKINIVVLGVRKGVLLGKKEFVLDLVENVEQEFLKAFYSTNAIPREILLNKECWAELSEKNVLEEYFSKLRNGQVNLIVPLRAEKLELVKLAEKNIDAKEDPSLVELQNNLNLIELPSVIECFDISNLGNEHIVSGMVSFVDGKPNKKGYRKFKIRTVSRADDFASMKEVVFRRYKRLLEENSKMPNLIVIDGGIGQVNSAMVALGEIGLKIPLIGLAKKLEEIYLPNEQIPLSFDKNSKMMLLLRRIRDATHDFSLGYNKKRRQMQLKKEFKK